MHMSTSTCKGASSRGADRGLLGNSSCSLYAAFRAACETARLRRNGHFAKNDRSGPLRASKVAAVSKKGEKPPRARDRSRLEFRGKRSQTLVTRSSRAPHRLDGEWAAPNPVCARRNGEEATDMSV